MLPIRKELGSIGNVELEDVWGSEGRIIDTARLSASDRKIEGKGMTKKDLNLLHELWRDDHGTPFETMYFRFRIDMPIFVARHLVKHRVSSWNEMSKRYRGGISDCYVPDQEAFAVNGVEILSEEDLEAYTSALYKINALREEGLKRSYERIEALREQNLIPPDSKDGRDPYRARARELWRGLQTVSEHSEVVWTINFRSLKNVFDLRISDHAQYETRKVAEAMYECASGAFPILFDIMNGKGV